MTVSRAQNRPQTTRNLPMVIGTPKSRPSLSRYDFPASFVSHLIAARDQMGHQRAKRRAPANIALNAYAARRHANVRRMPTGYRLSEMA